MMKAPEPLYPCHFCNEEYSWPASDLAWSERYQDWVCGECWCDNCHDDDHEPDERGERLSEFLSDQQTQELATLRAKADAYDKGVERLAVYNGKGDFMWTDNYLENTQKADLPVGCHYRKVKVCEVVG